MNEDNPQNIIPFPTRRKKDTEKTENCLPLTPCEKAIINADVHAAIDVLGLQMAATWYAMGYRFGFFDVQEFNYAGLLLIAAAEDV